MKLRIEPETYLQTHSKMREEFMTEEQISMCDKFKECYAEAHESIDRQNLFSVWNEIDAYYAGEQNEPIYEEDTGTVTNVINPYVEGQIALAANDPIYANVEPVEPSDIKWAEQELPLADHWIRNSNIKNTRINMLRNLSKYGEVVVTTMWEKNDFFGIPKHKAWDPEFVIIDPAITYWEDLQNARYIMFPVVKTLDFARENFGEEKAAAIVPGYLPFNDDWKKYVNDERQYDLYVHLFIYSKSKGKVSLRQMSACGVLMADADPRMKFPNKGRDYPITMRVIMPLKNTIHSLSPISLMIPLQNNINDLDNQILINARLTGNSQIVVDRRSNIDVDKIDNRPGLIITTDDINGIKSRDVNVMPNYIFNFRNNIMNYDLHVVSRFSPAMVGASQKGIDTATEAAGLQETGMAIVEYNKFIVEEMLSEIAKISLDIMRQYYDTMMAFRITGKEDYLWFKPSDLNKIPVLRPASDNFIKNSKDQATKANGGVLPDGWEQPKYEQLYIDNKPQYREATFDLKISAGAGMPQSLAFKYRAMQEGFGRWVDVPEMRKFLHDHGILPRIAPVDEKETLAKLEDMNKALTEEKKASAAALMMNAEANREKAKINAMNEANQTAGQMANGAPRNPASNMGDLIGR